MRGALALLSTQPLTWGSSLLIAALVPRLLGDEKLGYFSVLMTVSSLVGTVASAGIPDYLVRLAALQPERSMDYAGAALVMAASAAVLAASVLAVALPAIGFAVSDPLLVWLALAGMGIQLTLNIFTSLLRGHEHHVRFAWLNAASQVAGSLAGIGVLLLGGGLVGYVATAVLVGLLTATTGWLVSGFRLHRTAVDPRLWRELVAGGLPFMGSNIALRVRAEVDRVMLAALANGASVGWYAAAYRIISIPLFVPTLITTPLLPTLSRNAHDPVAFRRTLRLSVLGVLLLTVPACAAVLALAPVVPGLLGWPDGFANSTPLMMILSLQLPLVSVDMVLSTALIALHEERRWVRVIVMSAVFNIASNALLVPYAERALANGAIGASLATVATEVATLVWAIALLGARGFDRELVLKSLGVLVAGAVLAFVASGARASSVPVALAGGCVAYVISTLVLRVVRPADAQLVVGFAVELIARRRTHMSEA